MKTLEAIALGTVLLSGCAHDYSLSHIDPPVDTAYVENTNSDDTGYTESYNACDSYSAGWDITPESTERAGCIGIQDSVLVSYTVGNDSNFVTQLYFGNCHDIASDYHIGEHIIIQEYNDDGTLTNGLNNELDASYGLTSYQAECPENEGFINFQIAPYQTMADEQKYVRFEAWFGTEDEKEAGQLTANAPVHGILDCTTAATTQDCTVMMYH